VYVYQSVFRVLPLIDNYFSVINPSTRMSWIMNNWGKEWSDNAVKIVQELVSIVSDFERDILLLTDTFS
jgi:hypothetical protein